MPSPEPEPVTQVKSCPVSRETVDDLIAYLKNGFRKTVDHENVFALAIEALEEQADQIAYLRDVENVTSYKNRRMSNLLGYIRMLSSEDPDDWGFSP